MEPALPDSEPANAPPPPAAGGTLHFLLLALAGQRCALPRAAVRELLAGFANLGGEPLPVLHAARLLGLAALAPEQGQDALYRHIVVLELGGTRAGLLVDRVLDLLAAPAGSLRPVPPDRTLNGCVAAGLPDPGGMEAGGLLPVLDPARLLLAEERAVLQGLTEAARARAAEWTAG